MIALGVALALPALATPFALDDLFHIASLEGAAPVRVGWWELFTFVPGDQADRQTLVESGVIPWWSSPHLRLAFFRPLSSALVTLDHAVFGRSAVAWHLHSLLWWAALLVSVSLLYRRVLPERTALLALALFAIDDSHWTPIAWSAARNALVAMVPGLLGLAAHVSWRERGWRAGVFLGPLGLAVGLAGGEVALGVLAYVVAYELLGRQPTRRSLASGLLPYVLLLAVYASLRAAAGAGVSGSASYIDPTNDPVEFARVALGRLPALVANAVFNVPADLWSGEVRARPALVVLGVVALTFVTVWLRSAERRLPPDEVRTVRWMAWGALLALVPGAGAMLGERVLLPASLGAAVVFAVLLRDGVRRWREVRGGGPVRRTGAGIMLAALALPNLVLAAPLLVGKIVLWKVIATGPPEQVCQAPLEGPGPIRAVVVWAEEPPLAQFGGAARWFHCRGNVVSWTVLSMSPHAQKLERTSARELTLTALERPMIEAEWEVLFRAPDEPMRPGETVTQQGGLRITVQAVDQGRPTEVLFQFPTAIEESEFRLLVWRAGRLQALAVESGAPVIVGR